jgi:membrane protein DedA with SNARE-associated domain
LHFSGHDIHQLLSTYGYWVVMLFVGIESIGIPFPGETMLIAASIYAGTTHDLNIAGVIAAASCGAILGDNIGFWIGREFGFALLMRFHDVLRLDERRLKLGQYLFLKHGGKVVFFGRFVAVLRAFAALLAGINRMSWGRFLVFNCAGGIVWSSIYGIAAYIFGKEVHRVAGPVGIVVLVVVSVLLVVGFVVLRRNEKRLEDEAERHFPGPLDRNPIDRHPGL